MKGEDRLTWRLLPALRLRASLMKYENTISMGLADVFGDEEGVVSNVGVGRVGWRGGWGRAGA